MAQPIRRQVNNVGWGFHDMISGLDKLNVEAQNHSTALLELIHLAEEARRNNVPHQVPTEEADTASPAQYHANVFFDSVAATPRAVGRGARRFGNWFASQASQIPKLPEFVC
jgi:hypothetical protein